MVALPQDIDISDERIFHIKITTKNGIYDRSVISSSLEGLFTVILESPVTTENTIEIKITGIGQMSNLVMIREKE